MCLSFRFCFLCRKEQSKNVPSKMYVYRVSNHVASHLRRDNFFWVIYLWASLFSAFYMIELWACKEEHCTVLHGHIRLLISPASAGRQNESIWCVLCSDRIDKIVTFLREQCVLISKDWAYFHKYFSVRKSHSSTHFTPCPHVCRWTGSKPNLEILTTTKKT